MTSQDRCLWNSPPTFSHVMVDDITPLPKRPEVERITGHQLVRGHGGVIAALYEINWVGLPSPPWERELDLQHSKHYIKIYWSGTPAQNRQTNLLYRQTRIGAAHRERLRWQGRIGMATGWYSDSRDQYLRKFSSTSLPSEAHVS